MRIPSATYRLQMTPSFGFAQVREIVPYLAEFGISDLYVSPVFKAVKGSSHGYDVVDPTQINDELGGRDGLAALSGELKRHGMGWLQDIVPNHMAFDSENVMLMDVFENGTCSRYCSYFDIDWHHVYEGLHGRVLAPFLGRFYGEALEAGEIQLAYDECGLSVNYYDLRFPLKIESYARVFTSNLEALEGRLGGQHPDVIRYLGTVYALGDLPAAEDACRRNDQIPLLKKILWDLYSANDSIREFVEENLRRFNGEPGRPESFQLLDELLNEQHFRLAFWKVATEEINYRRFFTINGLISVRLEDRDVFDDTHVLVRDLCHSGAFDGLRVDHIDGLHDPHQYLERLRELAPDAYVVVEKILEHGEELPDDWPIAGTTGYEFLNTVNGVFCRHDHERGFRRLYHRFIRSHLAWEQLVAEKKRLMIGKHLAGNVDNLAHLMKRISSRDRHGNDITLYGLRRALVEVMAYFPVYRTYITRERFSEADHRRIGRAVERARGRNPALLYELGFLERFLHLKLGEMATAEERDQAIDFVMRFQQVTGPLMAKGVEDTCMYIYNRLLSLNEVGGSPNRFGVTREEFHRVNAARRTEYAHGLNTTATHDMKRGEDARARLNVLSELPEDWAAMVNTWRRLSRRRKMVHGTKVPDNNDEYFLYQTLVASWPFFESEREPFRARLKEYIIKAVREAKVHTAWLKPDEAYESAYLWFIDVLLDETTENKFLESFLPFWRRIAWFGMLNSFGQVLLKVTCPGVPDFYQGCEFWDLSMVDPDNRRPVDYAARREALADIRRRHAVDPTGLAVDLMNTAHDGRIKLLLTHLALAHRREAEELYRDGDYLPLETSGERSNHIIAHARRHNGHWSAVVVPRFLTGLIQENDYPLGSGVWQDDALTLPEDAPREWRNVITGEAVAAGGGLRLADALARFPVALMTGETPS